MIAAATLAIVAGACTPPPRSIVPTSYRVDGLVVEAAPPLDPVIAHALAPYAAVGSTRLLDISDDGRVALVVSRGEVSEIRDGHAIRRISGLDVDWARFASGDTIVATADRDGDEQFELYRQTVGADPVRIGTGRHAAVIAKRDAPIVWASNVRDGVDDDLWISDVDGSHARVLHAEGGQWAPVDIAADGVVLATKTMSTSASTLYRLDGGTARALTTSGAAAAAVIAPAGVIYAITTGRDHLGLFEISDRETISLTPDIAWDVTAVALSGDGLTVAFVTNEDARSVLHVLDTRTRRHEIARGVPVDGVIGDLRFAAHAAVLAMSYGDARHPRDAYRYDLATGEFVRWVASTLRTPAALVEPDRVSIASTGGVRVPALVYRPARHGSGRAPVVVQFHGGPEDQWLPRYAGFEQFLLARGYAIVQPDVRGSTGYGAAYAHLDDGPRRGDVIADVGAVLDWIATQPDLDARHVVAMGASYGGFLVLTALARYPDRLRGGIDMVGIADFVSFLAGTSPYRRDERRAEYGDERDPRVRDQLIRLSPLARAGEIRRPLLVAQGARDPRVPADGADRLVAAMRGAGQVVWYLRADDEGHGFTRASNRGVFQVIAAQFLDQLRSDR